MTAENTKEQMEPARAQKVQNKPVKMYGVYRIPTNFDTHTHPEIHSFPGSESGEYT